MQSNYGNVNGLLRFHSIQQNLPAWVIGDSDTLSDDIGNAWVLKIWPEREKAKPMRSDELNILFDKLQTTHCKA